MMRYSDRHRSIRKPVLKLYDSLHLACAHIGKPIFLTTDNTIINTARKNTLITIQVDNPVHWLMEVSSDENNQ
jgi:predicted nucleic acid-binding protein